MKKFKADTSLQEKLKAAADVDAVASIAIEAGFSISADDLNKSSELSDEELEHLAGGNAYSYTCTDRTACGSKGPDYKGC